jgi:hypothetical protein
MPTEQEEWERKVEASEIVQAELERLRTLWRIHGGTTVYMDEYIKFLTVVQRLFPPPPPEPPVEFHNVRL